MSTQTEIKAGQRWVNLTDEINVVIEWSNHDRILIRYLDAKDFELFSKSYFLSVFKLLPEPKTAP
jgi:hypothetical protein